MSSSLLCILDETVQSLWEEKKNCQFLKKLNKQLLYNLVSACMLSGVYFTERENIGTHKILYMNIHGDFSCNSLDMQTPKCLSGEERNRPLHIRTTAQQTNCGMWNDGGAIPLIPGTQRLNSKRSRMAVARRWGGGRTTTTHGMVNCLMCKRVSVM